MTVTAPETEYADLVNDPALSLTDFERRCALLWPECADDAALARMIYAAEYAEAEDYPKRKFKEFDFQARRRVRWAVERAEEQLRKLHPALLAQVDTDERKSLFEAVRGKRDHRSSSPLVGLVPYLDCADMTEAEYRRALKDPHNQQNVGFRSPVVTHKALRPVPRVERLKLLGRKARAAMEYAAL